MIDLLFFSKNNYISTIHPHEEPYISVVKTDELTLDDLVEEVFEMISQLLLILVADEEQWHLP